MAPPNHDTFASGLLLHQLFLHLKCAFIPHFHLPSTIPISKNLKRPQRVQSQQQQQQQ